MKTMVNWADIKVVIFDVDGTLYRQSMLRKKMLFSLLSYYAVRPWKIKELKMLQHFRTEREKKAGYAGSDLENAQFQWCAEKGNYSIPQLKQVVEHWMFNYPNKYLPACVYPGTNAFFTTLKRLGLQIAIYSDYKAFDKLKAMDLEADLIVASTDSHIDRLKPDPKALLYIANKFEVTPQQCLFIGDRQELDGKCAENAGMPYLIVDKKPFELFDFYFNLEKQLIENRDRRDIPQLTVSA